MYEEISEKIKAADVILVGLGENEKYDDNDMDILASIIEDKNYYIVSLSQDAEYRKILSNRFKNITFPFGDDVNETWENYMKWLQLTLNKNLVVMEFGVSFKYPDIIRFPFEKVVYYNKKAEFVRVNEVFYQLPKEISDKGTGIDLSAKEFLKELSGTL